MKTHLHWTIWAGYVNPADEDHKDEYWSDVVKVMVIANTADEALERARTLVERPSYRIDCIQEGYLPEGDSHD